MKIVIAGGGTGGHFFPAVAVIEEFVKTGNEVLYIGTEKGIEYRKSDLIPCEKIFINVSGVRGKTPLKMLKGSFSLIASTLKVISIINRFKPDRVLIFGGYVSLPAGFAARLTDTPLIIHEQNSIPGKTNKLLSKFASKILIANEYCRRFFPDGVLTGNPLRKEIRECKLSKELARNILKLDRDKFTILIFGGSQGAQFLNQIAPAAVALLKDLISKIQIVHISGEGKEKGLVERYKNLGVKALVTPFTEKPWLLYKSANVAVSRSGALAISELSYFGIPSIFVPYPFAVDDHQYFNAKPIADRKGCFLVRQNEIDSKKLANLLKKLYTDGTLRDSFSSVMKSFAIPDATLKVVREMENAGS
ncbi:undecaprenyldiphospho-muramoylpentapeptide beta-N-acetylglucosaminyltransferase [Desulfurobacterium sp.]|uniref:undecaprenyldiphospho-muramoylpentapeptide beta-N-acetylglucosaminyltransferase n=1 Tax=Desulfurobacterium sp. TaxID=2004706 RepID=UPI00261ED16B|nr:undecaprenyldiphospho-muramoylpentapeptide beta-N-acetylglucosaminyltransferase [Desulfurobacterium sp.]